MYMALYRSWSLAVSDSLDGAALLRATAGAGRLPPPAVEEAQYGDRVRTPAAGARAVSGRDVDGDVDVARLRAELAHKDAKISAFCQQASSATHACCAAPMPTRGRLFVLAPCLLMTMPPYVQFAELSVLCQSVEQERDYYFERLMEIESLCREAEVNGSSSLALAAVKATMYRDKVRAWNVDGHCAACIRKPIAAFAASAGQSRPAFGKQQ
jgi:hypothetical protein